MIGILLAIQVNNWNENRKKDEQLADIRKNVKQELLANQQELALSIRTLQLVKDQGAELIEDFIGGDDLSQYNDSMIGRVMGYSVWTPNTFALEELVNTGVYASLNDDSLINMINKYKQAINNVSEHVEFMDFQSKNLMGTVKDHGDLLVLGVPGFAQKTTGPRHELLLNKLVFQNQLALKILSVSFVLEQYQEIDRVMAELIEQL